MGASNTGTQVISNSPQAGSRIIELLNPQLNGKLQPFTDYIVQPKMNIIKQAQQPVEVVIFSTLDYSSRKQTLEIKDGHIGIKIKQMRIRDCILRITKVFPNSPSQVMGILVDQYIVGLTDAEYEDLKGFADSLRALIAAKNQNIGIGLCDHEGKTRVVNIPAKLLEDWRKTNRGILGCQLAEGWMNRFKAKPKKEEALPQSFKNTLADLNLKQGDKQIKQQIQNNLTQIKRQQASPLEQQQSDEIERRCEQLLGVHGSIIQRNFKGLLKSEYVDDASTICKCKVYNKHCEKCFLLKDGSYYFFNKKTNRIISIPASLMMAVN